VLARNLVFFRAELAAPLGVGLADLLGHRSSTNERLAGLYK
jgi:hypothetical protein